MTGGPLPPRACLGCGVVTDDATSLRGGSIEKPKEGAVSLCPYCGATALFTADGSLREPTEAEWIELYTDPDYRRAAALARSLVDKMPDRGQRGH